MSDPAIKAALEAGKLAMDEWTQGSVVPGMWNKEASAAAIAARLVQAGAFATSAGSRLAALCRHVWF